MLLVWLNNLGMGGSPVGGVIWISLGVPFKYIAAKHIETIFYLEGYLKAISGTTNLRLYDNTLAAMVTNSDISTTESSNTRIESIALTLTDGSEYQAQVSVSASDIGSIVGAKLVTL